MPLLPNFLLLFFCLFFFHYFLTHQAFQKVSVSSILHTGNHTLSYPHTHTHTLSITTIWLSIPKGHSQSLPVPRCRLHCLALSLELASPGHCFLCDLISGPFSSSTFQPSREYLQVEAPVTIITGRRFWDDSKTSSLHAIVPGTWEEERRGPWEFPPSSPDHLGPWNIFRLGMHILPGH